MPNDLPFFNSHKRQCRNKIRLLTNFLHQPRFVLPAESQNVDLMNGSIILLLLRLNRNHPKTLQALTFPCLIIKYSEKSYMFHVKHYFPMQNCSKIRFKTSSVLVSPINSPSASNA